MILKREIMAGLALLVVVALTTVFLQGSLSSAGYSTGSPVENKSGTLSTLPFLSATSCGTNDFDKCLTRRDKYGDAEAQPFLYYNELDVIHSEEETLYVKKDESIKYKCKGTQAWIQEGFSGPDIEYTSSGVKTDYKSISREGSIDVADYDFSNGFRLICSDYDTENGFWVANAVWFHYDESIKIARDVDGDGLYGFEDECPRKSDVGLGLKDNGCPIVDSDGDGFADPDDNCTSKPGEIKGCPDSDGDGVKDSEDVNPNTPGSNPDGSPTLIESLVQIFVKGWMEGEPLF